VELKAGLASSNVTEMKDAIKRVIAEMTVGKDMSSLVPDVVNCMRTDNLEAKKLVYLYLINYAKSNPDMTLMAVNSFVKDTSNMNPLLRALAIRTMGCIRVERITEHLCSPLRKALSDEDPYVRKTAAMCVAKLYDIDPIITREQGFLEMLGDLTADPVPIVVANAVSALMEIQETSTRVIFEINTATLTRLLAALKDSSEWGQVTILDALSTYVPVDAREAETVIERISPWLAHQNPAVVLNAVRVMVLMLESIESEDTVMAISSKLAPPIVTLAQSTHPEIQYVALRNISLIVQRHPNLLTSKVRVFFCKFNDPIYVKLEKLEVLVRLANHSNVDAVLMELREYAQEVDVEYVRRAVRTIGRLAIKLDKAADKCIKVLLQLIKDKTPGGSASASSEATGGGGGGGADQNYLVQEAVVVIKDIFRRYPNHYETVIGVLCEHLESLDEPEAKAALVWIIGEYADRIENAADLLEDFLDGFLEEPAQVQLALLTAVVKCYLKVPDDAQETVQRVLQMATEESDNPDLRDRGYIYWRLLSTDPDAARMVVLADKPVVRDDTNAVPESLLTDMLAQIGTLSSVYHKLPEAFVRKSRRPGEFGEDDEEEDDEAGDEDEEMDGSAAGETLSSENDIDLLGVAPAAASKGAASPSAVEITGDGLGDLFGAPAAPAAPRATPASPAASTPILASSDGLTVRAVVVASASRRPVLHLAIDNSQSTSVDKVAVRMNVNPFGLAPTTMLMVFSSIHPHSSGASSMELGFDPSKVDAARPMTSVAVALRDETSRISTKFEMPIRYDSLLSDAPPVERSAYLGLQQQAAASEVSSALRDLPSGDVEAIKTKLISHGFHFIAQRSEPDGKVSAFYSGSGPAGGSASGATVFVETTHKAGFNAIKAAVRSSPPEVAAAAFEAVRAIVSA
jgi:AP-1 complex subunit beta-1